MAEPSLADVHRDSILTNFSVAYVQNATNYIARRVSPIVPVPKQSDRYFVYNKADWLINEAAKRAPGTRAEDRNYTLSQDSYFCNVYSIAHNVSEQVAANADAPLQPEQDAVQLLTQDMLATMEVDFASTAFANSVWGTSVTGGTDFTQWNQDAAEPIKDLATGLDTVEDNTGFMPNTLILGAQTWKSLRHHPDIVDRLPDNAPRIATTDFLGNLLDIDNVVVARAIRNTADEGATASYSRILGSHALLAYVDPSPGPKSATAMRTFVWTGLIGSSDGIRVSRYNLPETDAFPRVEVSSAWDFKIVGTDLGYFFNSASA